MPQAVQGAPAVMLCCPSNCLVPAPWAGCGVPMRVLLAPGALSLGSPLPAVLGAARLLSCVAFVFPTERWSSQVTQILLSLSHGVLTRFTKAPLSFQLCWP